MNEPRRRKRHPGLWIAGLLVLAPGGYFAWRHYSAPPPQTYREAAVARGDLAVTILSTGIVEPEKQIDIKAPVSGRAEQVLVQEGQLVRKGETLAWVSSTERAALLDAARAKGPEETKRWEELYRATSVMAPVTGTIIQRNVEPGQTFTTQDALFVLSDRLIVKAQVDETDIAQVQTKQKASIVLDAYPDKPFAGKVSRVAFDALTVNNVTLYVVEVLPDETPAFMRSGMTANVTFTVTEKKGILLAPTEALKVKDGKTLALLKPPAAETPPAEREIKTGLTDGKSTEILSGLSEGEILLVPEITLPDQDAEPVNPFAPARPRARRR
ncbi:MAG: HlyD family efflux transporter periplasmic adaptor subunit [Bdellovibrionota bacterium]